jgi:hypothetical protein
MLFCLAFPMNSNKKAAESVEFRGLRDDMRLFGKKLRRSPFSHGLDQPCCNVHTTGFKGFREHHGVNIDKDIIPVKSKFAGFEKNLGNLENVLPRHRILILLKELFPSPEGGANVSYNILLDSMSARA